MSTVGPVLIKAVFILAASSCFLFRMMKRSVGNAFWKLSVWQHEVVSPSYTLS